MLLRVFLFTILIHSIFIQGPLFAEPPKEDRASEKSLAVESNENKADAARNRNSFEMLLSIIELRENLARQILKKKEAIKQSSSETEKTNLKAELAEMDKMLASANVDFERIATGVDISLFEEKKNQVFNWKDEVTSLMEPGVKELKRLTIKARQKTKLKDELSFYQNLAPIAGEANENLKTLIKQIEDKTLKEDLEKLLPEWEGVEDQIRNKLKIAQMQLEEMVSDEESLVDTSRAAMKKFVRTRGLFLLIALLVCGSVILLLRLLYLLLMRIVPGYKNKYPPFHIRALDLLFRVATIFATLFVLILVFYIFEDWVLLSLTAIFLIGIAWATKHALPRFWHQSRLMLNIGSVREGERVLYKGVPWLVKRINIFTDLENPFLKLHIRVPIEAIMKLSSRSFHREEPWFPCKRNDWVILADGTRGGVVSLSHEMVSLVLRGGARKTYQTHDFLAQSPLNLSLNFRLKVVFGIAYTHQAESTNTILTTLENYIGEQVIEEGYEDKILNLRIEFAQAGTSSLDLVVIADFKGEMAPLYNRLSRSIQRWCTNACTANNWGIPFPQITVHKGEGKKDPDNLPHA